ncbi:hypothetical protein HAX54_006612, partial [Datura stramonium]|nr:hypothetical protein [Datura stramonium]
MESSGSWVLPSTGGSPTIHRSLHAVRQSSAAFQNRDWRLADELQMESSGAWVLPCTGGSPMVRGSLHVVRQSSAGAARLFMMIPLLILHLIFIVVI